MGAGATQTPLGSGYGTRGVGGGAEEEDLRESAPLVRLRNADTGAAVEVPAASLTRASELRRRVRLADPQAGLAHADADIVVDAPTKRYWFRAYPPVGSVLLNNTGLPAQLGFLRGATYIVFGALLIAAAAQVTFQFPCLLGQTAVEFGGSSYCVANDRLGEVTPTACPPDACGSARILVTMQTYAVLLNGAVAGTSGVWATVLYVAMVCVGAPFGAGGVGQAMWNKGAIISPSGGYFYGFIFASMIMAKCAAKGHDRPRSAYWMVLWMFAAEAAIYACGLFWLPFGLAIKDNVPPSAICPASAGGIACLNNIFNWGFVPFVPGDLFKMLLVLLTVPLLWQVALLWSRYRNADAVLRARNAAPLPGGEADAGETADAGTAPTLPAEAVEAGKEADGFSLPLRVNSTRGE